MDEQTIWMIKVVVSVFGLISLIEVGRKRRWI